MEERPEELDEFLELLGKFLVEADPNWAAEVYVLLEKHKQLPSIDGGKMKTINRWLAFPRRALRLCRLAPTLLSLLSILMEETEHRILYLRGPDGKNITLGEIFAELEWFVRMGGEDDDLA